MNLPAASCGVSKPKGFPPQQAAGNYQVKIIIVYFANAVILTIHLPMISRDDLLFARWQ